MKPLLKRNYIYHGDNLVWMKDIGAGSIDLIYIDPPYGVQDQDSKADQKTHHAFGESIDDYKRFMNKRLRMMHERLKNTGVLCVHVDWRINHHIKVLLDEIFAVKNLASQHATSNFVSQMNWYYDPRGSRANYSFRPYHVLLIYAKDRSKIKVNKIQQNGLVNFCNIQEWENGGYPKIEEAKTLLDRLIDVFTDKKDTVADFFCGSSVTLSAAQRLGRNWIGVDARMDRCESTKQLMLDQRVKIEQRSLNHEDFKGMLPLDFQDETISLIGGSSNIKHRDNGVDGWLANDGTPIQVKQIDVVGRPILDNFHKHVKKHGRGIFIALERYTRDAEKEAEVWRQQGLDIQLLTVKDLLRGNFRVYPLKKAS